MNEELTELTEILMSNDLFNKLKTYLEQKKDIRIFVI